MSAEPFRPARRYVDTGKPCEHCGDKWALFLCPCGAHVCLTCAAPDCTRGRPSALLPNIPFLLRLVKADDVTKP